MAPSKARRPAAQGHGRSVSPAVAVGAISNFSGGPNFRDSPTELAAVEAFDAWNCSFDERGGVASRLGYAKRNLAPLGAGYKATVLAASPSLYWRLDEGVGALSAADASGNGRTGTYGSGVTLGKPGALTGDSDTAAGFDGFTNAKVVADGYVPFAAGTNRTFMGWANRAGSEGLALIQGDAGSAPVLLTTAGTENVTWTGMSGQTPVTWAGAWPGLGVYVFWALTYNDSTGVAELFINGVSKGQLTLAAGSRFNGSGGHFEVGGGWDGYLDEVTVFESILSAATITAIFGAAAGAPDFIVNDYYSPLLNVTLTQVAKSLYKADNTTSVHTFTTQDTVTFTDFDNKVIAAHPVDGIYTSSDGATWTKLTAANVPLTGTNCVAAWQARLLVGLTDGTVHWSNIGDITTWDANNFVAVWEKDQQPIVALEIGSGQDIQGNPGLLAFKQDSVYRINNATTGAYTSISTSVGAAGPKAVVGVGGRVCWISKHGIYWWREDQASPVNASDLLRPAWRPEQLSLANQKGWAAGRRLDRAYFSCSSVNSSVNDIAFEFHPDEGWVAPRSDAMTCYSTSTGTDDQTYGGSPTAPGQVYQLDTGGTDDGQPISGYFQTRWLVPNEGFQVQVWQARVHGRGAGTMTARVNYEDSGGTDYAFNLAAAGGSLYDNGVLYDSGATYVDPSLAETETFAGLGACRQFSLRFAFSVNTTVAGRTLFASTPAVTLGAFALYGVEILYIPLGAS